MKRVVATIEKAFPKATVKLEAQTRRWRAPPQGDVVQR